LSRGFRYPKYKKQDSRFAIPQGAFAQQEFIDPPPGYEGVNRWMNWHNIGIEFGSGYSPHLLNELQSKRKNIEACIVVVTGTGGKGKTYSILRLAELIDQKFDVDLQVPYGGDDFLLLIGPDSPLKMGQIIIVDESQFAMSNRDWYVDLQKDLMKQMEAVRSKGLIIFIVALSEAVLDVIARNYVITHKIHLMSRGHARAYIYNLGPFSKGPFPTTLSKDTSLLLPGAEYCEAPTCLKCRFSGLQRALWKGRHNWDKRGALICYTIRARYERKKKEFLERMANETIEKSAQKQREIPKLAELGEACYTSLGDLSLTLKGYPEPLSIQEFVNKKFELDITDQLAKKIIKWMMLHHPETFKNVMEKPQLGANQIITKMKRAKPIK